MPISMELTVHLENRPGTLGQVCRALADHKVNIVALEAVSFEAAGLVRLVVDQHEKAKIALDNEGLSYEETQVALAKLPHRLGELARAVSRLGEAEINIHYAYCGVDPNTNVPLLVFGVSDVGLAAPIVDRTIAAA